MVSGEGEWESKGDFFKKFRNDPQFCKAVCWLLLCWVWTYFAEFCDYPKAAGQCLCRIHWKSSPQSSLQSGLCSSGLVLLSLPYLPPWGCREITMRSFLGKSAVPVFSATLFPLVSYLSYLPALFLLALLHIPKVMTYFFILIFLSWFLVWFIPTCRWGLCVAQVWVGRPGRSYNILNLRFLYLDHTYPLYLTGLWWGSNKINLRTCLLKHKRVAFLIFPTSPRSLVCFLPWCPALSFGHGAFSVTSLFTSVLLRTLHLILFKLPSTWVRASWHR